MLLRLFVLLLNSPESLFDAIEDCLGNGGAVDGERILVCSTISFLSLYISSITAIVYMDLQCYYAKSIQINEGYKKVIAYDKILTLMPSLRMMILTGSDFNTVSQLLRSFCIARMSFSSLDS